MAAVAEREQNAFCEARCGNGNRYFFRFFAVHPNTISYRGVAQLGRALRSGRRSRKFESCHLDHKEKVPISGTFSLCLCVAFSPWLLLCNNASSVSPPGDLQARLQGAGRVNLRQGRIPCHLDHFGSEKCFSEPFSLPTAMQ